MPDSEFPPPAVAPSKTQLRFWSDKLWEFQWYCWVRGWCARVRVRLAPVPMSAPVAIEISMMRFRICLWENVPFVETGIEIPGEKVALLQHRDSNRVVGIKVWG